MRRPRPLGKVDRERQIVRALASQRWQAVSALVARTKLSPDLVRRHLALLVAAGQVERRRETAQEYADRLARLPRGKPKKGARHLLLWRLCGS